MELSQPVIDNAINEAVKQAAPHGWEAIMLVIVVVVLVSSLTALSGFIVRWLIASMDKRMEEATARENRMEIRLNKLETFAQTTLVKLIEDTSAMTTKVLGAIESLSDALNRRPCLLPERAQQVDKDTLLRHQLADSHTKVEP